jgi:hypothetical protein
VLWKDDYKVEKDQAEFAFKVNFSICSILKSCQKESQQF